LFFQLKQRANYSPLRLLAKRFNRGLIKRRNEEQRVLAFEFEMIEDLRRRSLIV